MQERHRRLKRPIDLSHDWVKHYRTNKPRECGFYMRGELEQNEPQECKLVFEVHEPVCTLAFLRGMAVNARSTLYPS